MNVIFSISQGMLPLQPFFGAKSTSNTHLVVRMTFARAAPPANDKKGNCYALRRQKKLTDSMEAGEPIN